MPYLPLAVAADRRQNGALRNTEPGVVPAVVVGCDIRRGRAFEVRQHSGDEMYREGRLSADWAPSG